MSRNARFSLSREQSQKWNCCTATLVVSSPGKLSFAIHNAPPLCPGWKSRKGLNSLSFSVQRGTKPHTISLHVDFLCIIPFYLLIKIGRKKNRCRKTEGASLISNQRGMMGSRCTLLIIAAALARNVFLSRQPARK